MVTVIVMQVVHVSMDGVELIVQFERSGKLPRLQHRALRQNLRKVRPTRTRAQPSLIRMCVSNHTEKPS